MKSLVQFVQESLLNEVSSSTYASAYRKEVERNDHETIRARKFKKAARSALNKELAYNTHKQHSNSGNETIITYEDGSKQILNLVSIKADSIKDKEKVTEVKIGNSVKTIGKSAFYYCVSLTSITIPNSVTCIGYEAFSYCVSLTSITIPNSVTSIGYWAFYDCVSLSSITIPDSVKSIGNEAFAKCESLTSINIPDGMMRIGDKAFAYCNSLSSMAIPSSVKFIGDNAFGWCERLKTIKYGGSAKGAPWGAPNAQVVS